MPLFDDTRADWGAASPLRTLTRISYALRIGVSWHWIGGGRGPNVGGSHAACLRQVKAWQYLHQYGAMKAKDIGYNGLICQHARAIEGRGVAFSGSHSPGVNDVHIGYQFMVGAGDPPPSAAMIARAEKLRADTKALCPNIRRDWGHRDDPEASTECPGDWIDNWADSGGPTKGIAPVVTAPGVYPGTALKRGDSGPKVAELQTALGLAADGSYGPGTEAAVTAYQTANGLQVDGITGPATWASIFTQEDDDMATPAEIWNAPLGVDPKDGTTPVTAGYSLQLARNYAVHAWKQGLSNDARIGSLEAELHAFIEKGTSLTLDDIKAASKAGATAAIDEKIADADVSLNVTQGS